MPRLTAATALLLSAMALAPSVALADGPPKLNVGTSCQAAARSAVALGRDKQACLTDEKEAQETLTKNWNSNTKANQKLCVEENTTGGPSSYVELLSCLDVMRDAKKLGADPFRGSTAPGSPPASGSATAQ